MRRGSVIGARGWRAPMPRPNATHRIAPMRIDTFAALRHRDYRVFFIGQLITVIGRNMRMVAVGWLVYELTNSRFMLGAVSAIGSLPMLLLPSIGGAVADRLNKRRMLIVVEALSAVPPLLLAFLVWTGSAQVWQVAVLSCLGGILHAFEMPTRHSFVIEMVGRDDLMNAIALNSTLFSGARAIGPAVAGLLIDAFDSTAPCFLITGLGFSAIIIALALTRVRERKPGKPQPLAASLVEGLRYARSRRIVSGVLGILIVLMVFAASYSVLLPVFAKDIFGAGPRGLGFLTTSAGIGALIGALIVASLARVRKRVPLLFGGVLGYSIALFCFSFVQRFSAGAGLLVFVGLASMCCTPTANTILQTSVPDEMRGRIMGLYAMSVAGMRPLGSFTMGTLAEWFDAPEAIRIGACICGACGVGLFIVGWRRGWLAREVVAVESRPPPVLDALGAASEDLPRGR